MKKLLLYVLLSLFYLLKPFNSSAQKKYNVLLIYVDDMSIAFDQFGNPDAPLPNFARMLQHGMLFKTTYCQYGLCSPSRTSLLSGIRPDSTQIFDDRKDIRTVLGAHYKFLPEYFHDFGYRTEKYGKISCGHDDEISWDYVADKLGHGGLDGPNEPHWWIDTANKNQFQTSTGILTDEVIDAMKKPVAQPFFYGLGLSTHNPFTPILDSWNKTGDSSVKRLLPVDLEGTITNVRGNGSGNILLPNTPANDTADIPALALEDKTLMNYPTNQWKGIRHAYYAEMIGLDVELGKILDVFDRQNLWKDNIIVFVSDHGLHMGEHDGLYLKQTFFEEVLRIPFVICAPGKKTGVCNKLVEGVDVFQTLVDLCGLPAKPYWQGTSLVPLLENPNAEWGKAIFATQKRNPEHDTLICESVRNERYHYNDWRPYGEELYDLKNDPHEYTNLAQNSDYNDVLKHMQHLVKDGWRGALPPAYAKSTFYKDNDGDGYGTKTDSVSAYFKPDGYSTNKGDYNDNDKFSTLTSPASSLVLSLYPNPSKGIIQILYSGTESGFIQLKILDVLGKTLLTIPEHAVKGSNKFDLDLSNLKAGMYSLLLNGHALEKKIKFVIDK